MTNFDRIKAMDISALTELLTFTDCCDMCVFRIGECKITKDCGDGVRRWLEAEAEK